MLGKDRGMDDSPVVGCGPEEKREEKERQCLMTAERDRN